MVEVVMLTKHYYDKESPPWELSCWHPDPAAACQGRRHLMRATDRHLDPLPVSDWKT